MVNPGMPPGQQAVLSLIAACKEEQGISLDEIVANLKPKFNEASIKCVGKARHRILFISLRLSCRRKFITALSDEGAIYSTVDDEHFKTTD